MADVSEIKCPRCRGKSQWENNPYRPFCSEKCKMIDLGRWADEEYRIPGKKTSVADKDNVIEFPLDKI